uniref:Protein containing THAP domain n=1 Tax=Rhipicephalus zambeziensis TaxID=60191 RepID=A0A224Z0E4_9ACAR
MPTRNREKRDSTCFVPGCNSGYRSCKTKFSLFRAPKEPERLQQWARNIKRGGKTLDDACVVCERHFEPSFIERTFKIVIQGKVEEIPTDVPLLVKVAVPTIFPDAPKYLSKCLSKWRFDVPFGPS